MLRGVPVDPNQVGLRLAVLVDPEPHRRDDAAPRGSRIMEEAFHARRGRPYEPQWPRAPRRSGAAMASQVEVDPQETREWLEALDAGVSSDGPQRAQFLLERGVGHAQLTGAAPAPAGTTP